MAEKKYYWLKLKDDFFGQKAIKKLRKIAGGDTYTVIYLKMLLSAIKQNNKLYFEGVEDTFPEELALELNEDPENVKVTLAFLERQGLIQIVDGDEFLLTQCGEMVGSESGSASRVRKHRKNNVLIEKDAPKTNAERQRNYRAKKVCEKQLHVPLCEDHLNKTRYGGNYYIVLRRDSCKCRICGSIENICVHHIDGFDEDRPENNSENQLLTLCRKCHSNIHNLNLKIPAEVLESIGYYDEKNSNSNDSNDFCNDDVTVLSRNGNTDIEKDIDTEKDIYKYLCPEAESSGQQPKVEIEPAAVLGTKVETEPSQEPGTKVEIEPSQEVFIKLPLLNKTDFDVTRDYVNDLQGLYPAIDVEQAFRNMRGWLDANPKNRKTARGIKRFINNWLSRDQDRAPRRQDSQKSSIPQNRFNNFPQREYDFEELEKQMLNL